MCPGGTPYNGLYLREGSDWKGYLFQVSGINYERVGISLVEVYKRGKEICHFSFGL